ncbi:MAG: MarC family protein [Methanomassiliicoccales archaeon]|nr:MarC family protein [Methanomassiliicoccales archaeon]
MSLEFAVAAFAAIFAIVNPIGNIPLFTAVTEGYSPELKRKVIVKTCLVTFAVLTGFGIFGQYVFLVYGITIPAFKIAGGILLFSVAFSMMQGRGPRAKISEEENREVMSKEDIGVVPLGIPLFAGPGAITTVMIYISYATTANDAFDLASIFISIIATTLISYLLLTYSQSIFDRMGRSGALAFSRIMGLLLAAVAVSFIMSGIFEAVNEFIKNGLLA